jgi:dipeptidase E
MKVLMLSSSRCGQEAYLQHARTMILEHLHGIDEILFIPYAGVTLDWDNYTQKVQAALPELKISGIHQFADPIKALQQAKAIAVGGGNTFHLLHQLYHHNLLEPIRQRVAQGIPYIGWSAGSNICGNSIRTTNDMPIVQPPSFDALNLVPFQLNPHYSDYQSPGHNGETRAERIAEFCALNPTMPVLGIREGTALKRSGNKLSLQGKLDGVVFLADKQSLLTSTQDLSSYLSAK